MPIRAVTSGHFASLCHLHPRNVGSVPKQKGGENSLELFRGQGLLRPGRAGETRHILDLSGRHGPTPEMREAVEVYLEVGLWGMNHLEQRCVRLLGLPW